MSHLPIGNPWGRAKNGNVRIPECLLRQNHRSPLRKCQARKPYVECGGLVDPEPRRAAAFAVCRPRRKLSIGHHSAGEVEVKSLDFGGAVRYSSRVFS